MDRCNTTEDLGMIQTWINQSDPHPQVQEDAVFAKSSMDDDVSSLATSPTTAMTTSTSSSLAEGFGYENLDSVHDDNETHPPAAQEEKRSSSSRQTTTTKLTKTFGDIRLEARQHLGMDGTIIRPPSSLGHKPTRKLNKSFSDSRSAARHFTIDGTMSTPSRSTSHKTTRLNTRSFRDIRSEIRHHISTDGTVMRIASKAHVDPEFKLAARRSLSIPRRNLQGMRGRRPSTRASASDLLRNIEKAPAVLRTRSMGALALNRHIKEKYSAVLRRTEVRSAIDEVLAAYDDSHHKGPSSSDSRRSDSKVQVQYNARTPSFGSATTRSAGQTNRAPQLATKKVKSSRDSFQKVMDESIESDFELSERNSHHNATFEHIQETMTSIQQQLREKDEQIKKLSRQLQDARALNQEKDLEIKRSKSIAGLSPTNSSVRRSSVKPRKQKSDESEESSSVVRRIKKEKASKNATKREERSASSSSRKKGVGKSRRSLTQKTNKPRRSTSRLEDGKKTKESKIKRTKSESQVRRSKIT